MMHGQGMQNPQYRELLIEKIRNDLPDDQKTELIGRMIDSGIVMKEGIIEYLKFRIDTFRMVNDFLCE